MGRARVPGVPRRDSRVGGSKGRRTRGPAGPKLEEVDGHWHVRGTVSAGGRSKRLRRSTFLPATAEHRPDAEELRRRWEREIVDELVHGIKPTVPAATACRAYLGLDAKGEPLPSAPRRGAREIEAAKHIVEKFGTRPLAKITDDEWRDFIWTRHAKNRAATRERYISSVLSILGWCSEKPRQWLQRVPQFERDEAARQSRAAARRRVVDLDAELVWMTIEEAPIHLAGQLAVFWSTGARVSSVLYHCPLFALIIAGERSQVGFTDSKNGDPVYAALHPLLVPTIEAYLEWRGNLHDREGPAFVTNRRGRDGRYLPYADNGKAWGGQNKSAWRGTRRRVVRRLLRLGLAAKRAGDLEQWRRRRSQARLMAKVTLHWIRHWVTTNMLGAGVDIRTLMEQMGWRDPRSPLRYSHRVDERVRAAVAQLPLGGVAASGAAARKA